MNNTLTSNNKERINSWEILNLTSRTFYLSIKQLPGMIGEAICLAYLLLRVSDFFEDNPYMQPDEKIYWLNQWDQALGGAAISENWKPHIEPYILNDPEALTAYHAEELLLQFNSLPLDLVGKIIGHIRDTTRGMARWILRGPNVSKEEDMDDYMHEVAGRVGYLITEVFARYSKRIEQRMDFLMPLARETGLALQTVNILRGLRKDYERGWIFVPESFCDQVGIKRDEIFNPDNREKALLIVDMLADKSEKHLMSAMKYIKAIPADQHRLRLAIIWPILFAARTVSMSRRNQEVLEGNAKVQRSEIKKIIRNTTLFGWSNLYLDHYFSSLLASSRVASHD